MKRPVLLTISTLALASSFALVALAQQPAAPPAAAPAPAPAKPPDAARSTQLLQDASQRTAGVKANLERIRRENERRAASAGITRKEKAAVDELLASVDQDTLTDDQRNARIQEFLKTASPQVREMFVQPAPGKPPVAKPVAEGGTKPSAKPGAPLNFSDVPEPPKKVPGQKQPDKKAPSELTIDSEELLFRQDSRVAIFRTNVRLRSPGIDIDCDELEVLFKEGAFATEPGAAEATPAPDAPKGAVPSQPKPPAPTPTPGAGAPSPAPPPANLANPAPTAPEDPAAAQPLNAEAGKKSIEQDKIEKAWARSKGSIVTIVRRTLEKVTVCKCGEADFDGKSQLLTLKIFPVVEQGLNGIQGTARESIITIDKAGQMHTQGPNKMKVLPDPNKPNSKSEGGQPSAPAAPTPAPAPAPTAPRPSSGRQP